MRSDTRAATRLVPDWLLIPINRPRPPLILNHPEHIKPTSKHKEKAKKERSSFDSFREAVFENSYSADFESAPGEGSFQVKRDQF